MNDHKLKMSIEFNLVGLSPYHIFIAIKNTTNSRSLVVEALFYEFKGHKFKHFLYILLQEFFNKPTNQFVCLASKFFYFF